MTAAGPAKAGAAAAPATRSPQHEVAKEDSSAEQRNMVQETTTRSSWRNINAAQQSHG
jgi:hypothetical protein